MSELNRTEEHLYERYGRNMMEQTDRVPKSIEEMTNEELIYLNSYVKARLFALTYSSGNAITSISEIEHYTALRGDVLKEIWKRKRDGRLSRGV